MNFSNKVALYKNLPAFLGVVTVVTGCVVLLGWQFNILTLQHILSGLPKMTPNTAVGFILSGLSLSLYSWDAQLIKNKNHQRRLAQILAILVMLLALQTVGEYLFNWDIGIDQLLYADAVNAAQTSIPGRPSPHTAAAFSFIGFALILIYKDSPHRHWLAQYCTLTALFIALLALVGYIFRISYFFRISSDIGMALHTATTFLILGIGILLLNPDRGFMTIIVANNAGGKIARRLLLIAVLVPVIVGIVSIFGERAGLFSVNFVPILLTVLNIYIYSGAVWWIARSLNQTEAQRQQIEETLRLNEERTRLIIESALDAVVTINSNSIIIGWNSQAEMIFGWSRQEALGKSLDIILPHQYREAHHQGMRYFLKTNEGPLLNQRFEITALHREGTEFPVELAISPIPMQNGVVFSAFIRDITQRKRLESQFLQAQKMEAVGQLTAGIAHDFNNLLTVITINAQFMQIHLPEEGLLYSKLDNILKAGTGTANLIRQLLIFSRKQITAPKTIDLNTVITEMNQLLERVIGENIEVTLQLTPNLWPIKVDPAQMEQIVVNLVVNARDAMPMGGKLIVETKNIVLTDMNSVNFIDLQPGEYILLTVSDTGVGMNKEVQTRLFEPFFTTKAVGKGTGLGLATVYGIVMQNNGHISVYSEERKGSSFKIYLPRSQGSVEPTKSPSPLREAEGGHETILIVEDDPNIRKIIKDILQEKNYTVIDAEDGETALHFAAQHSGAINLLLTDVIMPGMSGKALAKKLIKKYPHLKIIYMSGYSEEIISHHGILESGIVLLEKPFSLADMLHKIREVLG